MAEMTLKLAQGERAQRKTLITVAEWTGKGDEQVREILGARTEDSSIEFNPDVATSTDILGITYTDVNKTEPNQSFDPYYILGGSKLSEYLVQAALENDIQKYNGKFTIYIIAAFINDGVSGMIDAGSYKAIKHTGCSIIPQSIGGDAYTGMPIEVHYSNNITVGSVDSLSDEFEFTEVSNLPS
jgi:hypothetical protein